MTNIGQLEATAAGDGWAIGDAKEAFKVFEKGILKGKCTDLSFEDGQRLFAVCYFLGGVRGVWGPSLKKPEYSSFHDTVTLSDWAFGFMLLSAHRAAWLLELAQKKSGDAKRSRADQQKCMKEYHDWFKLINESMSAPDGANKDVAKNIDSWLIGRAKEFSKVKVNEDKKPPMEVAVKKEDSTYNEATFENMREANPFLLGYTFEAI
jgi:hypothetical protein